MGQYFAAVNTDKKEFVCPWCVGQVAKLWEWAANAHGAIFTLLLRQSSGSGGGDYYGYGTQMLSLDKQSPEEIASAVMAGVAMEGQPIPADPRTVVGRWAGDRVALVGDYDDSRLWNELYVKKTYRNVSGELVEAWNAFIELEDRKLTYRPCGSCGEAR